MPGEKIVWADMLTREAAQAPDLVTPENVPAVKSIIVAPFTPGVREELDWPTKSEIARFKSVSKGVKPKEDGEAMLIPTEAKALKLRIIIAAHNGAE